MIMTYRSFILLKLCYFVLFVVSGFYFTINTIVIIVVTGFIVIVATAMTIVRCSVCTLDFEKGGTNLKTYVTNECKKCQIKKQSN
jgi:hypothetical protein